MSRLCRFFVILIAACTAAGCFSPIGSIDGSGASDLFWVVPNRLTYNLNEQFLRNKDLLVYASYNGVAKSVSVDDVKIGIADNPNLPNILVYIPLKGGYLLNSKGIKIVVVEYEKMSTRYSIEVLDTLENESGSSINLEWAPE